MLTEEKEINKREYIATTIFASMMSGNIEGVCHTRQVKKAVYWSDVLLAQLEKNPEQIKKELST